MTTDYRHLLAPGRIGAMALKNRLVLAAMGSNFADADGRCNERIIAYYEARARGGAGLPPPRGHDAQHDRFLGRAVPARPE